MSLKLALTCGVASGRYWVRTSTPASLRHCVYLQELLDPAVHGCGFGRDNVAALARFPVNDRGHHRLMIDPATDNEPAICCFAAVGFGPVGIMRRYERDPDGGGWHDGLLMDLLAEELDQLG